MTPGFEERVRASFARQLFLSRTLGARLGEIAPGRCEVRVPFAPALGQQHGFFHAGVVGAAADTAAGYAAYTLMAPESSVLSVEYKLNLLRPAAGTGLVARARVVRAGRTVTACAADCFVERDGAEVLCATALLTMIEVPGGRAA